jgi:hypothetical protein
MTFRDAYSVAKKEFPTRLAALRGLSYGQLAELPPWATSEVYYGEHMAGWTVYRDERNEGQQLMIVLQLSMKSGRLFGLFPMGNVDAEGFVIEPGGGITVLQPEELYDFM